VPCAGSSLGGLVEGLEDSMGIVPAGSVCSLCIQLVACHMLFNARVRWESLAFWKGNALEMVNTKRFGEGYK
jgi:hypothetical protein